MLLGPFTNSAPSSPRRTCTPCSGCPTLSGKLLSGRFPLITGLVSVKPYPCTTGNPSPINTRDISGDSGAPPLIATRKRPPNLARILSATNFLSSGHSNNLGCQAARPCSCSKRCQPTSTARANILRFSGGPSSSLLRITPYTRS